MYQDLFRQQGTWTDYIFMFFLCLDFLVLSPTVLRHTFLSWCVFSFKIKSSVDFRMRFVGFTGNLHEGGKKMKKLGPPCRRIYFCRALWAVWFGRDVENAWPMRVGLLRFHEYHHDNCHIRAHWINRYGLQCSLPNNPGINTEKSSNTLL